MSIFSIDLYGKETVRLEKGPMGMWRRLFIQDSLKWQKYTIDEVVKKNEKREIKMLCGGIGDDSYSIIDYALRRDFKVSVISGPDPQHTSFINPTNIDLYSLKKRPEYHFSIIGSKYLYLEDRHNPWEHTSIGVVKPRFMNFYENYFYNTKSISKKLHVEKSK